MAYIGNVSGFDDVDTEQIKDDAVTADKLANSINTEIAASTSKLSGIETAATADQTNAEIKTAVEAATSIALGGSPTTTTQSQADNSTKLATTAYTDVAIAALADSAPGTLNTLNELAAALGDDASFSTTVTNSIATKLPLAGGTMTGDTLHGDNVKAKFGTGGDLEIFHDGTHSYVSDVGTGPLRITTNGTGVLINKGTSESMGRFLTDGAVELFYDNALKIATTNTGVDITGTVTADALTVDNLTIDGNDIAATNANGNISLTPNGVGNVEINSDTLTVIGVEGESASIALIADEADNNADVWKVTNNIGNTLTIGNQISGSIVDHITITPNATVANSTAAFAGKITAAGTVTADGLTATSTTTSGNLRAQNSASGAGATDGVLLQSNSTAAYLWNYEAGDMVFATANAEVMRLDATGVNVAGTIKADNLTMLDNEYIRLGNSNDLQMYHNGSDSIIQDTGTGNLKLQGSDIRINNANSSKSYISATDGGSVLAYHNGISKLATTATGVDISGSVSDSGGNVRSGRKNWIINGGFDVWQRSTSAAQTNGGFVADRWKGNNYVNGTFTFSKRTDATGQTFKTYGRLAQSSAGSQGARQGLMHYIEGNYLVGKTITVSFKARANAALTGCIVRGIIANQNFNLTTSFVKHSFTATALADGANTRLMFDFGLENTTWHVDIAEVQVEVGSVATDFEHRSYGEELALCQRYFYNIFHDNAASTQFPINYKLSTGNNGWITFLVPFPASMRTFATFTHSLTNAKIIVNNPGTGNDNFAFYIQNQGYRSVVGNGNISTLSGGGVHHGVVGTYYCSPSAEDASHIYISSGTTFQFDAEL